VEVSPELRERGIAVTLASGLYFETSQSFIFRREAVSIGLWIRAKDEKVRWKDLRYRLVDAAGVEIGAGELAPSSTLLPGELTDTLQPGMDTDFVIRDVALEMASKVIVRLRP
jgi:hypothetical protein